MTFLAGKLIGYVFSGDRSGQRPARLLGGTKGSLVVDGYTGYNDVTDIDGRTGAGCWSPARLYLFRALEQAPEARALDMILALFRVERDVNVLHSLVQTAERHGINPLAYLEDVLMLVQTLPAARIEELLPDHWKPPDV